jgi:carbonic anhydrase
MFDDLLDANRGYQERYTDQNLRPAAAKGLAVVTCIDSRLDPLGMLGLVPGDAKILRNAGGRITDDAIRSLVLSVHLLGVDRVAIVHHTNCAVIGSDDAQIAARVSEAAGADASHWDFLGSTDRGAVLREDLKRLRDCPLLPADLEVGAFLYDIHTGALEPTEI